jgi:hypothetical protein
MTRLAPVDTGWPLRWHFAAVGSWTFAWLFAVLILGGGA